MSTELTIAQIKSDLALVQSGVDEDTRAVAGSGASNKRISIKGGVFRKMVGGKEIGAIEDRHMNVIFVKMAHTPSRTFYESAYQEGAKVGPVCWSTDSKVPDEGVKHPQGPSCDKCPQSIKGTGQGGQGTACRLSWRTAVVLPNDPGGDVMQLVLPATSVFGKEESGRWPFRAYIQMLANNNVSAGRVVTKMQFDTKAATPRVLFVPVGAVQVDDIQTIMEQSKSPAAENAVKLTVFQQDEGEAPAAAEAPAPTKDAAVQVTGVGAEGTSELMPEPKLREAKPAGEAPADVSAIVSKWSKKK